MKPREFHLPTSWRVRGTVARAYDILSKPLDFVRWWPEVYLKVREVNPGDADGVGRIMELHTKGWLPYRLAWRAELIAVDKPRSMSILARGDLDGRGEWRFTQDGDFVDIHYDWAAFVPFLGVWSFQLDGIFIGATRTAAMRNAGSSRWRCISRPGGCSSRTATTGSGPRYV